MKTLTLTADNHIIDVLMNLLQMFPKKQIAFVQTTENTHVNVPKIMPAKGMFAKGNEHIDFDEIDKDLSELSRQSEQHMLERWDRLIAEEKEQTHL